MDERRVIVIHGSFGFPEENWFPWLCDEVRRAGGVAIAPAMPFGEDQTLNSWARRFDISVGPLMDGDILVGHSMGAGFIVRLLEKTPVFVHGCVYASGFMSKLGLEQFDEVNATFVEPAVDWARVRTRARHWHAFHGSTDPYVPVAVGAEFADRLGASFELIDEGGHLNAEAGFTTFPAIREKVLHLLQS